MVNFSSLHDDGRPADVFYHHRRDTLVTALPMVVKYRSFWPFTTSALFLDEAAWRERNSVGILLEAL